MKKTLLILCATTLLLTMCKTNNQRDKLLQEIKQAEQEMLYDNFNVTLEKSEHLMNLYLAFASSFPQDSLTPEFLFTCAAVASASQQELYAITLYQRIYDEYPGHALRPVALLHWALVYDNMGNAERAKPLYEQFLVMFPDNPYVTDVKHLLEMVDKSPEEWELLMQRLDSLEQWE